VQQRAVSRRTGHKLGMNRALGLLHSAQRISVENLKHMNIGRVTKALYGLFNRLAKAKLP
jgi:hypothetical protein